MLYLVLAYLIISAICLWTGWLFYQVLPYSATASPDYKRPVILYLLTGLALLTGIGQWWILFYPLNDAALPLTLLGLAIPALFLRRNRTRLRDLFRRRNRSRLRDFFARTPRSGSFLFITACCALLGMILVLNAGPTIMDDTDSYHIQMVKWIREYGTVPGIANLHLRFGFNSSWFTAIGLLYPRIAGPGHYLILNGLLSCWFGIYLLQKIVTGPSQQNRMAAALLLTICILVWPMIRGNAASTNYDFISTCCILVLLSESTDPRHPGLWPEWILWPCFLFTVRIINTPLLLLSLLAMIGYFRLHRRFPWTGMAAAAFFILPFLIRNVLLSGYILFPIYQFDFFSFDWAADKQELIQITDFIKYFNRSNGNIEKVSRLSFPGWLPVWFQQLFFYDKILVGLALLAWTRIGLQWKKGVGRYPLMPKGLVLILVLSILCWLLEAPDPRFLYGPLLAGPYLLVLLLNRPTAQPATQPVARPTAQPTPSSTNRKLTRAFLACLAISVFAYTIRKIQVNPDYRNPITPRPLPSPTFKEIQIDGIALRIPDKILNNWNPRCYDLPLPCLYRVNPRLHSRGKDIRDGFRLEGPSRGMNPGLPVGPDNPPQDNGEFKLE